MQRTLEYVLEARWGRWRLVLRKSRSHLPLGTSLERGFFGFPLLTWIIFKTYRTAAQQAQCPPGPHSGCSLCCHACLRAPRTPPHFFLTSDHGGPPHKPHPPLLLSCPLPCFLHCDCHHSPWNTSVCILHTLINNWTAGILWWWCFHPPSLLHHLTQRKPSRHFVK